MIPGYRQVYRKVYRQVVVASAALLLALAVAACGTVVGRPSAAAGPRPSGVLPPSVPPPNVLLITADDLNYDSVGVYGCRVAGMTPHIDRLAGEGMRFEYAHVTIAVCQPCRSTLLTGRYPHNHGALGFQPIRQDVPTLTEQLRDAGYINGILGKVRHLAPRAKFAWDFHVDREELGEGRAPQRYKTHARRFLALAKKRRRPFFLMANSHDPHRPFAGSAQERRLEKRQRREFPAASRRFRAAEVDVPGFLPPLPDVRRELAQYFTSVHRCDETVGVLLDLLRELELVDNTIVIFLSDHGMALPFAKTNVYLASTKVPWIVRWPGRIAAGAVDRQHFISAIDLMPTVLAMAGVDGPEGMDGRSFLPLLRGRPQAGRDRVVTVFHRTAGRRDYPMRCLQTRRFGYIRNAWSDGRRVFKNESQSGLSFRAMQRAAATDPAIKLRVELFRKRVPEELYDFAADPNALTNLVDQPAYAEVLEKMRRQLLADLAAVGDPEAERFVAPTRQPSP